MSAMVEEAGVGMKGGSIVFPMAVSGDWDVLMR
jgi:hypothetical protein